MLSGPRRRFCEGIVAGKSATDAYAEAYPKASRAWARKSASRLAAKSEVKAEIERLRSLADEQAGSAVLTLLEKRMFLARLVRVNLAFLDLTKDGDLLAGIDRTQGANGEPGVLKLRLGDKLRAIEIDNDLAGDGHEAEGQDALSELLLRIRE